MSPIFEKQFATKIWDDIQGGLPFPKAFEKVVHDAQQAPYFMVKEPRRIKFLLFEPPEGTPFLALPEPWRALEVFLRTYFQFINYQKQYKALSKSVQEPYKKLKKALNSCEKSIAQLENERTPEELGHILMANLHQIPEGAKRVELEDLYLGGTIAIKLDPKLSPQANAQRYYDKYKAQKLRLEFLYKEWEKIQAQFEVAQKNFQHFEELLAPERLSFGQHGLKPEETQRLKKYLKEEAPEPEKKGPPFRQFTFMGYAIFVGKSSRNNDELSFKFAHKEDLWLHAKDVAGSHVVIRQQPGKNLPTPVLEYAASLAAYYSKSKNDTVVPVIYTPRKYIRKRKGDPPGMVVVNREEVILVEPLRKTEIRTTHV